MHRSFPLIRPLTGVALSLLAACTGSVGGETGEAGPSSMTDRPGTPTSPGTSTPTTPTSPTSPTGPATPTPTMNELFTCRPEVQTAAPRRLWRLTSRQYAATVKAAFGMNVVGPLPFDTAVSSDRYSTNAGSYSMNDQEFRTLLDAVRGTATAIVAGLRADAKSCLGPGTKSPLADCLRSLAQAKGTLLFRRPVSVDEVNGLTAPVLAQVGTLGEDLAAEVLMQRLLTSVSFLFRTEIGAGTPDAQGNVKLTPAEIASAIAYTLTDEPPDALLTQAATEGRLTDPAEIRAQVERLLGPSITRAPALRFFREMFHYSDARQVFKEPRDFPFHDAASLVDDTERFVADILATGARQDLLGKLLTSPDGFARKRTAASYNVTEALSDEPKKITFPKGQRSGLLTQPSWLVKYSKSTETEPVQRGRFIAENLLCQIVPDIPIGVVPALPDLGAATMRERLKVHATSKDNCRVCHDVMDPLGLAFESYDHVGRHRTRDGVHAIDASGVLNGSGGTDGPFDGALSLTGKLATSPVVASCFVLQSFRYWMGREAMASDGCSLRDVRTAFDRGDYVALLTSLFSSRSFLTRSTRS